MSEADMSVCDVGDDDSSVAVPTAVPPHGEVTLVTPPSFVFTRTKPITTDDFNAFKDEIKNMISSLFAEQKQETMHFSTTLVEIKKSTTNVENSISLLSSQYQELNNKVLELETICREGNEQINLLEDKIETLQIVSRKCNFELKNVPRKPSETKGDLVDMVLCLSSSIGGNLKKEDIKDAYRVRGKKEQQNPLIVVETSSAMLKSDTLRLSKAFNVKTKGKLCAKHLGFHTSEDTPVFICEQLTAKGARLYYLARDLAKSVEYKFCWTAYAPHFDNEMPTQTVHTAYLNLNDLSKELYDSIVNSEFSHAVEVSKNILDSNNAWIVSDIVRLLAQENNKNLTSYAYKLWYGGQRRIVLDCLPPAFKTIFNEESVTLVDKLFNLALKLAVYEYSDGDREAWGDSEDKTSKRVEWKLIPVWENNKVLFRLKNIDCVKFLKLEVGQDSAGDRGAFGSPSDKSDTVRHEWFLEPVTINGEILFYIINKQFSQGLKLAMAADYANDRRLWGHRGDVHGEPSRFAWSIKKY